MINILPDDLKTERRYGRLNRFMLRQLLGAIVVGVLAVGFMLSGLKLVNKDESVVKESIVSRELKYAELKEYEQDAKEANAVLSSVKALYDKEVKFSDLLQKIASSLPLNTRLKSLSLTGNSTETLQIVAEVDSQDLAAVLRKTLVDSEIFESADILSIVPGETNDVGVILNYDVTMNADLAGAEQARTKEKAANAAADAAAKAAAAKSTETPE